MTKLDPKLLREKAGDAAKLLKLLANDKRLLVLCRLLEGERSVGSLAADVGLSASAISQHLAKLRADGILATRRDSQTIFYRLASKDARDVMTALATVFCPPPKKKRKAT